MMNKKLGEKILFIYNGIKKEGVIYSINPIAKTYDIFCEKENLLYKDISLADIQEFVR